MYEMYIVQGIMSGVLICYESDHKEEAEARQAASDLCNEPTFEGNSVRIITRDGELVWDSAQQVS